MQNHPAPNNSPSENLIFTARVPFSLWLEFEETSGWEDLTDDCANISVRLVDGRSYHLNVWTFKFFQSAFQYEGQQQDQYLIPPDLFVKELTRECIEKTMVDLLKEGNDLRNTLNPSVFGLNYRAPYESLDLPSDKLEAWVEQQLQALLPTEFTPTDGTFFIEARHTKTGTTIVKLNEDAYVSLDAAPANTLRLYSNAYDFWEREMKKEVFR